MHVLHDSGEEQGMVVALVVDVVEVVVAAEM